MTTRQRNYFLLTTALFWAAMYTYPVLLSNYVTEALGAAPAIAGMVVGSYGFTQMLLRIPVGFVSDKIRRRKPFLILGVGCALLAALGLYLARGAYAALFARGMAGVSASTWVCFTVLFGSYQTGEGRVRAMGTLSSYMYAAQLIATLLGGALARAAGVRASFLLAAALGLVGLLCATRVKDAPPHTEPVTLSAVVKVLKDPLLLYCAFLSILMQMIVWSTLYGFSPGWAEHRLQVDAAQLGVLSTVHLIPTILFAKLGSAYIVPRIGERKLVMLGFISMALGCLLLPYTTAFWQMLCLQALCGIGVGCISPLMLGLCGRNISPSHQGIAMGAYQSLYGIGMFIGPMLAGWLVELASPTVNGVVDVLPGYRAVFICAGVLALIGCVVSLRIPQRPSKAD